ncbi:M23 family metallopeptidase [Cytobacillus oceanisediminis]|uniref:M23 family metallopeptidase n=1 Tax=Cytobacillus oceanisediminis TaxID=665099 RepID=UPI001864BA36|nr:M23 family metallopeptidase [Cytobacillus oceanisediminis]QOK28051.1 M23 family metallopeptidase [Cytobacillus oceanisediminis]
MFKRLKKVMISMLLFALVLPLVNSGGLVASAAATFIMPAEGTLSSGYGMRDGVMHHGIDISKSGTVPIYASAGGTVSRSYISITYGEVVMIQHTINGELYETVYAHMQTGSRKVSEGQSVKQGQLIGYMGNTGQSYGQHLHFEIHKGTWNSSKSNSVNPLLYIGQDLGQPNEPIVHTYDGSWAWLRIDSASGADQVNLFGHPGYGLLSNKAINGSAYKVYDKQKSTVDGHYYYNIGNSQWVHEDNVGEFHQYVATVDYQWAVNVYDAPNGNYKGRLEPGSSYKVYKAKDGWYDLGNSTWIKQEYVKVIR